MKKNYTLALVAFAALFVLLWRCSGSDDSGGDPYVPVPEPPAVTVDLSLVPYAKLSDYHFFSGTLKDLEPNEGLLPYEPSSPLFTDYAHKKRFVWMPEGTKATYVAADVALDLPVGAVLIKNFYYDEVSNAPVPGATRIIETRLMIRKTDGWIFADYVWNDGQTEAFLDLDGSITHVEWTDNGTPRTADYQIPNEVQCIVCHKSQTGGTQITNIPIGVKPQNLNFDYNYDGVLQNQLTKWVAAGYLDGNFTPPTADQTVVNYNDAAQPVSKRARAYFDSNCSHCHMNERHCDYRPMRFAWSQTAGNGGLANMGVCVNTQDMQGFDPTLDLIVHPRKTDQSMLFHRLNTTNETIRMPLHGRTLIHTEGLAIMQAWIDELDNCD